MADEARSKAAADLRRKLSPPPAMNQSRLAEKLGVSQQAVSSWLKGRAIPEPERMAAIEELLGIPMRDWVVPAESDFSHDVSDADDSGSRSTPSSDDLARVAGS